MSHFDVVPPNTFTLWSFREDRMKGFLCGGFIPPIYKLHKRPLLEGIFLILALVIFLHGSFTTISRYISRSHTELPPNQLCSSILASSLSSKQMLVKPPPLNLPLDTIRDICDLGPFQFDKFVWLLTDGMPRSLAEALVQYYKNHSINYLVNTPGIKYSHAIYTSYLTGLPSTQYTPRTIPGDSLLRSMVRVKNLQPSAYPLVYSGPSWSFLYLIYENTAVSYLKHPERYATENRPIPQFQPIFDELFVLDEPKQMYLQIEHTYPLFFDPNFKKRNLSELLSEYSESGKSVVAHSGVFDHVQHEYANRDKKFQGNVNGLNPTLLHYNDVLNTDLRQFRDFVDSHPDYLLVLASDHGMDEGKVLHGSSYNGNSGYFLLYNPRFQTEHTVDSKVLETWMDVVDVACTLALYLRNVDIPADSIGMARNKFGTSREGIIASIKALKQNLLQILVPSQQRKIRVDEHRVTELILWPHGAPSNTRQELLEHKQELEDMIDPIKGKLWSPTLPHASSIVSYSLLALMVLLYLLFSFELSRISFGLSTIALFLTTYGWLVFFLLPPYWRWAYHYNSGKVFLLVTCTLAFVYSLMRNNKESGLQITLFANGVAASQLLLCLLLFVKHLGWLAFHSLFARGIITCLFLLLQQCLLYIRPLSTDSSNTDNNNTNNPNASDDSSNNTNGNSKSSSSTITDVQRNNDTNQGKHVTIFSGDTLRAFHLVVTTLCVLVFEYTDQNKHYYVDLARGFHWVALLAYALIISWVLLHIMKGDWQSMVYGLNFLLFLLWKDSPSSQLLLVLYNAHLMCVCGEAIRVRTDSTLSDRTRWHCHHMLHSYLFAVTCCLFIMLFGHHVDLSVDPMYGKIGMISDNLYPLWSAFHMGFAKYGPFYVSLFCHLFVQSAFASSSTKSGKDKGGIGVISNAQQQQQHRHSFTNKRQQHLFLFILLLTFCMGVIGFNWLVFVHTMAHSFQEPLATLALFGSVGVVYCVSSAVALLQNFFVSTHAFSKLKL